MVHRTEIQLNSDCPRRAAQVEVAAGQTCRSSRVVGLREKRGREKRGLEEVSSRCQNLEGRITADFTRRGGKSVSLEVQRAC